MKGKKKGKKAPRPKAAPVTGPRTDVPEPPETSGSPEPKEAAIGQES